jgi:hypothetical protein
MAPYVQLVEEQEVFCSFSSREFTSNYGTEGLVKDYIASGLSAHPNKNNKKKKTLPKKIGTKGTCFNHKGYT